MRYIGDIIDLIRTVSENEDFTENSGIGNDEILQYLNEAQVRIQSAITGTHPHVFQVETEFSTVANQEAYDIPWDAFLGNRIDLVEHSSSTDRSSYITLKQGRLQERISSRVYSTPSFYIRRSGKILLQPAPGTGNDLLRITYQKRVPIVDLRRGKVLSVTLGSDSITALALDPTIFIDKEAIEQDQFVTVVDRYGSQKMRRIPIDNVDSTTGVVTVTPGFVFESGESIAVGDYLVRGGNSSSHSALDDICEPFLIKYGKYQLDKRDSSNDIADSAQDLTDNLKSIVESYSEPEGDVQGIPILDNQYIDVDGFI